MCNCEYCQNCSSVSDFRLAIKLEVLIEFYLMRDYCEKDLLEEFYIKVLKELNMTDKIENFLKEKERLKYMFTDIEREND